MCSSESRAALENFGIVTQYSNLSRCLFFGLRSEQRLNF